jgi:hypothetical protein
MDKIKPRMRSRRRPGGFAQQVTAWAYGAPADLHKGFDGLSGLVTHVVSRLEIGSPTKASGGSR